MTNHPNRSRYVWVLRNGNQQMVYPYIQDYRTEAEALEAARKADGNGLRYGMHPVKKRRAAAPEESHSLKARWDLQSNAKYSR